jgi:hypothetical protein
MNKWMIAILAPGLSFGPMFMAGGPAELSGVRLAGVVLVTATLLVFGKIVERQARQIEQLQERLRSSAGEG